MYFRTGLLGSGSHELSVASLSVAWGGLPSLLAVCATPKPVVISVALVADL